MKKFICYVPMQTGSNLFLSQYEAVGNPKLQMEDPILFPVTAIVNGYVSAGEDITIIAILEKDNPDCAENLLRLRAEIEQLATKNEFSVRFKMVEASPVETVENQLETFSQLISLLDNGDQIHGCMTFGTKPIPIVEFMAMHFAYKTKTNVRIECLAYSKVNWRHAQATDMQIYDVTALFFMHEISGTLAETGSSDPVSTIRRILNLGAKK